MPKYFHELTLSKMIQHHDFTYECSDDHRAWKNGRSERALINEQLNKTGWTDEIVTQWNKYAPKNQLKEI